MTTWGLIGSGNIGSTVARLAVDAGDEVILSNSRGPETLAGLVEELGPRARAATTEDAATEADVVVVSVPLKAYTDLPADALAGKVVMETTNYYPARDGHIAVIDEHRGTSSELVQAHLKDSQVVKVFNNIYFGHLAALPRPTDSAERSALPIAGDDAAAKATVTGLLDTIGYDAVDVGPLSESWRFEPGAPAYGVVYFAKDGAGDGSSPGQMPPAGPTPADAVRESLAKAERG